MLSTSDGSVQVNDLVLIVGAEKAPVQGVVTEIQSDNIAKVRTATGTRIIFVSGLRVVRRNGEEMS